MRASWSARLLSLCLALSLFLSVSVDLRLKKQWLIKIQAKEVEPLGFRDSYLQQISVCVCVCVLLWPGHSNTKHKGANSDNNTPPGLFTYPLDQHTLTLTHTWTPSSTAFTNVHTFLCNLAEPAFIQMKVHWVSLLSSRHVQPSQNVFTPGHWYLECIMIRF